MNELIKIRINGTRIGESSIIEWKNDREESCFGIIDCGLGINKSNATLLFLQEKSVKKIDFIILSHPHFDHYSGLNQVFKYCFQNNILIEKFIHTMAISPKYLNDISMSVSLSSLIKQIIDFHDSIHLIQNIQYGIENVSLQLNKEIQLKFHAPSENEFRKFTAKHEYYGRPDGNLLSAVISLQTKNSQVVFMTDATIETLDRLRESRTLVSKITKLAILPHNGSRLGFSRKFWDNLLRKDIESNILAIQNSRIQHPNIEVLEYFIDKSNMIIVADSDDINFELSSNVNCKYFIHCLDAILYDNDEMKIINI